MKSFKIVSSVLVVLFFFRTTTDAQTALDDVKSAIEKASMQEQNAFKKGECAKVLNLMASDITFLANGRKVPSKVVIGKFCNSLPRPFKAALFDTLVIYPLRVDSGYTIRTLEYPKDETAKMQEFVTKIWRKTHTGWQISHLHSTVKEVPISK
jgi:ketosteroid isomerase-like protein